MTEVTPKVAARRAAIYAIVAEAQPMSVRQIFYQATVRGIVQKTEPAYARVASDLVVMRRAGEMPYDWIVDGTRSLRVPYTFSSPLEALQEAAVGYRKALWDDY